MWHPIQHWLAYMTGSLNTPGAPPNYNFWSGAGSDLGEVTIVAALAAMYRKHTCEVHGCWRLGRHTTAGGHHVCRRHHPDGHLTAQTVEECHRRALPIRHAAAPDAPVPDATSAASERMYNHERDGI